jgi:hypothetical protein
MGVCCEVMNRDGTMAGAADLEVAALRWGLPLVDIADLRACAVTAGPLAGRDLYDDPAFFDRYQRLRAARAGLDDELEHPVCTAANPMTGWLTAGGATVWPVDHYAAETAQAQQWLGRGVLKYHRRVTTVVGAILAAGLAVTALGEPWPGDEAVARRPDLAQHRRRPPILLVAARKPPRPDADSRGGPGGGGPRAGDQAASEPVRRCVSSSGRCGRGSGRRSWSR